jgi:hypothetical protein
VIAPEPANPLGNTLAMRSIMYEVHDVDDPFVRLRANGGMHIGAIENYENYYRLCYVHGPAGIIVALAQQLS